MKEMEHPDSFHLNAAQVWLGLDDPKSAIAELEQITTENHQHPAVLLVRFEIYSQMRDWDAAAVVSGALTKLLPEDSNVWVNYAYSTRRKSGGGVREAKNILLSVESKFPEEFILPFNLACYCSQMKQFGETEKWLKKAVSLGNGKAKSMAIEDADLSPFWSSEIGKAWGWE